MINIVIELLVLVNNTWNHLTVCKKMSFVDLKMLRTIYSLTNHIYIYIYIYKLQVKLATIVEGDPMAPFLIATTPRCRGGHYSFPWIAPVYPWSLLYNAEC